MVGVSKLAATVCPSSTSLDVYKRQANAANYHITRMGIFGSVARGEETEVSDIDICFEGEAPTLFTLARIKYELEELLGRDVYKRQPCGCA